MSGKGTTADYIRKMNSKNIRGRNVACRYCNAGNAKANNACNSLVRDEGSGAEWVCTRMKGHSGQHIACGAGGPHAMKTWPNTEAKDKWETIKPKEDKKPRANCLGRCKEPVETLKYCNSKIGDYYVCTQPIGHSGPHIACTLRTHNIDWAPNGKPLPRTTETGWLVQMVNGQSGEETKDGLL